MGACQYLNKVCQKNIMEIIGQPNYLKEIINQILAICPRLLQQLDVSGAGTLEQIYVDSLNYLFGLLGLFSGHKLLKDSEMSEACTT